MNKILQALPTVGIVGVGRMGANMARRLYNTEVSLSGVYDTNTEKAATLALELNCQAFTSLKTLTEQSEVIITVVSDDRAMENIYTNPSDNLLMAGKTKIFLNCATVHPRTHTELKKKTEAAGGDMLEVPMASSIPQAQAGTLFLMCAGEKAVYLKVLPLLQKLGETIYYTGEAGTASKIKALVNMVMNINTAALAEGLGLADALGLDLELVQSIFSQTGAHSRVLETDSADMIHREYDVYFSAAHAAKDSHIALALGQEKGLPMVVGQATANQYSSMVKKGLGEIDKSGIAELTFQNRLTTAEPCTPSNK